jgi:diguanylate cyclase (GGDEF)-like protein
VRAYRRPEGAGLSGACWSSGEIVNVADVRADPRYMMVLESCQSEICVPIIAGAKVLGVLGVQGDRLGAFDREDERLLGAYARFLAMGLVHARTHQARRKDIAELRAISEVARRAAALDLSATLDSVCGSLRTITTSDSVAVYLWDARSERLSAAALSFAPSLYPVNYEPRVRELRLALGEGMVGWSALHRQALCIADVAADGRAIAVAGTPLGQKSAIVIPLVVDERLVGVARAVKMGLNSYTDDHFRFAQTIASQAALAIAAAEAHAEIRRLSVTDDLTGAYNSRHLMQRLREELDLAKRHDDCVSVLVLDGDRMKMVNDQFGHAEGNGLLVQLAETLRASLRTSDVLARFGGDEFVIVLPRACASDARVAAERLRQAVATHEFRTSWGERIRASLSIGVATSSETCADADALFRAADRALYESKQHGRNRVTAAVPTL